MQTNTAFTEITGVLSNFGLCRRYKGFSRLVYAIYLVLENERRLEAVVKEVYMPVAEQFDCSWCAVERSFRDAVTHIWISDYETLCRVSGTKLKSPPTPADMLDIIARYIKDQHKSRLAADSVCCTDCALVGE